MLCHEGWKVNLKRVYRLWRSKGYRVEARKNRKALSGSGANACNKRRAGLRNDIWAYDFIFDRLENGRPLKILAVTDEYTRESLALEVSNSIPGSRVTEILNELVLARGLPSGIRSDNGPEFIGKAVGNCLKATGVEGLHVEKASPW